MNYIGSKQSILGFIEDSIDRVTGFSKDNHYVFADLFAGTGVVGSLYRAKGYKVLANDIQYYSYVLNKHFIENSEPLDKELIKDLNSLEGIPGFIYNNYCAGSGSGRNYFTDFNGKKCDAIRMKLEELYTTSQISKDNYMYYLASLINSIDKYANTASVYGAFLKHIKSSANKEFKLELLPIIDGPTGQTYNDDISNLIGNLNGDVLYLDPPYNARQYSSNYHVLETIALYDNPVLRGKTGLRDYTNQKSDFCYVKRVAPSFENIISKSNFKYIFLSYNDEGLMPLDTIKDIMKKYGEYHFFTYKHKRFQADKAKNRNIKKNYTTEYLHCLIKE